MPELPEVETLKLGLQKYIIGKTITDIDVRDRKLFSGDEKNAIGATIKDVRRFAKGIVIDLDNGYSFAVHIKLTGQLIFRDEKTRDLLVLRPAPLKVPNKFTRVVIKFGKSSNRTPHPNPLPQGERETEEHLYFQEVRGFAWMKLLPTEDVPRLPFFKTLGPEPAIGQMIHGQALDLKTFENIVQSSNLPIKVLLMEQKKIGGVGNIYANDACFCARIDPRRRAKSLTHREIDKLYTCLLEVLKKGLNYRGSSELNFVDVLGQQGEYQKYMLVYGKKGKACIRCGSLSAGRQGTVQKIYLGGRGTFFCPACQH